MRQAQIAEQDRVYQQSVNTEKEKAVGAALQIIRSGGTLKNDTLCYYKDDGSFVETSLILYLMREYHIDVPLRTQGWIKCNRSGGLLRLRYLLPRKKEPMLAEIL